MLQLAKGFAALAPTRVLWAMPQQGLPDGIRPQDLRLGRNTLMVPWVDYNVSGSAVLGPAWRAQCARRRRVLAAECAA
jgi:hypothetical protein